MRKVALTLVAVAVALGLTTAAQQPQPAQPTLEIKIVPERPTVNDKITVELSGTFPNRCIPEKAEALVEFNQVTIRAINEQEFCVEGQTPWKLSVPVPQVNTDGKRLEAGPYQVVVLFSMEKDPDDYLLLGRKRFDIVGSGALGEQADQAEQALIPFFISLQHKHSSLPWVSQGRVRSNTVSSVSNRGGEGSLPATIAAAKGDVIVLRVTTVRGTKSNSDNRIVDCQGSGLRIRAVKSGADDQNRQQLEIEVEITGEAAREQLASTYASLTCLVEQVNGPDLDVSLTVLVRRYTEREQVYCDFTTLTRVRNVGKGSAGGVALKEKAKARNWNNSKPNLYRYGMIGGGSVSSPSDIFTRMSPGTYEFEAEVESLDAKESNTRNNKVLRVAVCR